MAVRNSAIQKSMRREERAKRKARSPVPYATEAVIWDGKRPQASGQYVSSQTGKALVIPIGKDLHGQMQFGISKARRF